MLKIIIWVVIVLSITFFVVFNVEPKVKVSLLPGFTLEEIPLALVIIISFILGLLSGLLIFLSELLRSKLKLSKLEKEIKELSKEKRDAQTLSSS